MGLVWAARVEEHRLSLVNADQQEQVPPVGHGLPLKRVLSGLAAGLALPVSVLIFFVKARPVSTITIQIQATR